MDICQLFVRMFMQLTVISLASSSQWDIPSSSCSASAKCSIVAFTYLLLINLLRYTLIKKYAFHSFIIISSW